MAVQSGQVVKAWWTEITWLMRSTDLALRHIASEWTGDSVAWSRGEARRCREDEWTYSEGYCQGISR